MPFHSFYSLISPSPRAPLSTRPISQPVPQLPTPNTQLPTHQTHTPTAPPAPDSPWPVRALPASAPVCYRDAHSRIVPRPRAPARTLVPTPNFPFRSGPRTRRAPAALEHFTIPSCSGRPWLARPHHAAPISHPVPTVRIALLRRFKVQPYPINGLV